MKYLSIRTNKNESCLSKMVLAQRTSRPFCQRAISGVSAGKACGFLISVTIALFGFAATADTVYVTYTITNSIEKFDLATGADLGAFAATGLSSPQGMVFDNAGNLYVANVNSNTIEKFSPTGADLGVFASTGLSGPTALVFDGAGNLYAANSNTQVSNSVEKFSSAGVDLGVFASGPSPFNAYGMVFDSAGNLYVENAYNGISTIEKFSPTGADLGVFASAGLSVPTGLILDNSGNFYALNSYALNTIEKFSPTGVDLGVFANTPSGRNYGIASDSAGNFYVTNNTNGKIEKFSMTGVDLGAFATTGPNGLNFIVIQHVPFATQVQQPINADGSSVFNAMRGVVPVKFTLSVDGAATCNLPSATISVTRTAGGAVGPIDESVYVNAADSGSNFRISNCQYVYNLATNMLGTGTYRVDVDINGTSVGNAIFGLR